MTRARRRELLSMLGSLERTREDAVGTLSMIVREMLEADPYAQAVEKLLTSPTPDPPFAETPRAVIEANIAGLSDDAFSFLVAALPRLWLTGRPWGTTDDHVRIENIIEASARYRIK